MSAIYYDQFIIHQNDQNFHRLKDFKGLFLYLLGTYKSMEPGKPTQNDTSTKKSNSKQHYDDSSPYILRAVSRKLLNSKLKYLN